MRHYITSSLSEHIKETPEGYLLCLDVPISRTGECEYLPEEVPVAPPPDGGSVRVERPADTLFSPATMASFEGKPVTLDHPAEDVGPESWRELAVGVAQNLRQGEGEAADLLLADLLITDAEAIAAIREGLREISCGYDAEYEELAPGAGRQTGIIGNHVALVEAGRCGSRCRINDSGGGCAHCRFKDQQKEEETMKKPKRGFLDWLKGKPKLQKAFDEALAEAEEEEKKEEKKEETPPPAKDDDPLTALAAKVEELTILVRGLTEKAAGAGDEDPKQTGDEEEKQEETGDEEPDEAPGEKKTDTGDKKQIADADTVSKARLLCPGLHARVGDSACAVQRAALRAASRDKGLSATIDACLRGVSLDKADSRTLDIAFAAAAELRKALNNQKTADALSNPRSVKDFGRTVTPADINAANRAFYEKERK
jgi:hypothetical protein